MFPPSIKWVNFTQTIYPRTGIHYLDALDENGRHWAAQMHYGPEQFLTFISGHHWELKTMSQPSETFVHP